MNYQLYKASFNTIILLNGMLKKKKTNVSFFEN